MKLPKEVSIETLMAHIGEDRSRYDGAVVPPIFQNSLFTFEDWDDIDAAFEDRTSRPIYTRLLNPTTSVAEQKIAALATTSRTDLEARLTASGMAAVSAVIFHSISAGDHIVAVKNVYGPTNNFLNTYLRKKMNVDTTFVPGTTLQDFEQAITPKTKLIVLESPSSAVFSLQNIQEVTDFAREKGITTIIDNTWATPFFQKPLDLGIDFEVHSVSKYLGGHSDVVAGVIIASKDRIQRLIIEEGELFGGIAAPLTSWLITRSLRTLSLRLERHQKNALAIAAFLEQHPKIDHVRYPGLKSHPQYDLACRQMTGFTGLMSFQLSTDDLSSIKRFFNGLTYFQIGVSWGGHESLIYAPAISYLKELPPERFKDLGITLGDMRISVGLEEVDDLIQDLSSALEKM
ncbi:aminotransferase class I/II-fold pyridoxal phosphate-dependent enzyme [bacterium]|jgi:cystathionine beta-lyase/cystathionine gamma-synthase|nr:aminotransferase class I/II-fold pyridoxal phosphate-dependent enzyme [bacterium]